MPSTAIAPKSTAAPKARKTRTRKATPKATPIAKVTTTTFQGGKVVSKKSEFTRPSTARLITWERYQKDISTRWAIHQFEIQELIKDLTKAVDFFQPYHTELVKRVKAISWQTGTSTPSQGCFFVYNKGMRNLQITEAEENVLVQMAVFFTDLGTPDDFDQDAYDSLFEKITDPSPFDYSWAL